MDDRVLGDDAVLRRVGLDHLELDRSHASSDEEGVALSDGSVGCFERWGKSVSAVWVGLRGAMGRIDAPSRK